MEQALVSARGMLPASRTALIASVYYGASVMTIFLLTRGMGRRPRHPVGGDEDGSEEDGWEEEEEEEEAAGSEASDPAEPVRMTRRMSMLERTAKSKVNPFFSDCWYASDLERVKMALLGPVLVPLRFCGLLAAAGGATFFANLSVLGLPQRNFQCGTAVPLGAFRRALALPVFAFLRLFLFSLGYMYVETEGRVDRQARLVVCNHLGMVEPFILCLATRGSPVSRLENAKIPFLGALARTMQCIFVDRSDPDSRRKVAAEILERATQRRWRRPVFLFPEGTTTNGRSVITFKVGAFAPRLPVQPVIVDYPHSPGGFHPAWVVAGPSLPEIMLRMMCQPYNRAVVKFLPAVKPLPHEQDARVSPKVFAARVQRIMAAALGVKATDHSYEDVVLHTEAAKVTRRNLRNVLTTSDGVIEFRKLRDVVDVTVDDAKAYLRDFHELTETADGRADFHAFRQMFADDVDDEVVRRIFSLLDEEHHGYIDYRQYVIGAALFAAKTPEAIEQALKLGFRAFDVNDSGFLEIDEATQIIHTMLPRGADGDAEVDVDGVFHMMDSDGDGRISEDEFIAYAKNLNQSVTQMSARLFSSASADRL